jgi:hypothetical protein
MTSSEKNEGSIQDSPSAALNDKNTTVTAPESLISGQTQTRGQIASSLEKGEQIETDENRANASKRHISLDQWLSLSQIAHAKSAENPEQWIDNTFSFPGNGKIVALRGLDLRDCPATALPGNLLVKFDPSVGWIYKCMAEAIDQEYPLDLAGSKIERLPSDLAVEGGVVIHEAQTQLVKDANELERQKQIEGNVIVLKG